MLLILSPGTDPGQELSELAAKSRKGLTEVALGQGQVRMLLLTKYIIVSRRTLLWRSSERPWREAAGLC